LGQPLCGGALGSSFGNFVEQVWGGAALWIRSSFEEHLCTAALHGSFEEPQLWFG